MQSHFLGQKLFDYVFHVFLLNYAISNHLAHVKFYSKLEGISLWDKFLEISHNFFFFFSIFKINCKIITARFLWYSKTERENKTNYSFFLFGINRQSCALQLFRFLQRKFSSTLHTPPHVALSYEWKGKIVYASEQGRKMKIFTI